MDTKNNFIFSPEYSKKKSKNILTFFIIYSIIITVITLILAWMLLDARNLLSQENIAKTTITTEKDNLLHKLKNMEMEYDELSKEYEGLDSIFSEQKETIKKMMKEIQGLKGNIPLKEYEMKVKAIEDKKNEFINRINELKSGNEALTVDNLRTKNTLDSSLNKAIELSQKNQELSEKIKKGSALKAYSLKAVALRSKPEQKDLQTLTAKKTLRIKTCFTLAENALTSKGNKSIYVRIADPDNAIMANINNPTSTFSFKGKNIIYSEKLDIYYENKSMDICIDWVKSKELKKGTYYVDVFMEDNLIGTTTLSLE